VNRNVLSRVRKVVRDGADVISQSISPKLFNCQSIKTIGSGTGTNNGGTCPALRRKAPEIFLVVPLHIFGFICTISRFGERFRDGQ